MELDITRAKLKSGEKVIIVKDSSEEGDWDFPVGAFHLTPDQVNPKLKEILGHQPDEHVIWIYTGGRSQYEIDRTLEHELAHLERVGKYDRGTVEGYILEELDVVGEEGIRVGTRQWLEGVAMRVQSVFNLPEEEALIKVSQLAAEYGPGRLARSAGKVLEELEVGRYKPRLGRR